MFSAALFVPLLAYPNRFIKLTGYAWTRRWQENSCEVECRMSAGHVEWRREIRSMWATRSLPLGGSGNKRKVQAVTNGFICGKGFIVKWHMLGVLSIVRFFPEIKIEKSFNKKTKICRLKNLPGANFCHCTEPKLNMKMLTTLPYIYLLLVNVSKFLTG